MVKHCVSLTLALPGEWVSPVSLLAAVALEASVFPVQARHSPVWLSHQLGAKVLALPLQSHAWQRSPTDSGLPK